MQNLRRTLVGDKAFYKAVFAIVTPIIIQNAITNFVSLLDNIMVGQVGTVQMSGVAIANTLLSVHTLCVFGAISGVCFRYERLSKRRRYPYRRLLLAAVCRFRVTKKRIATTLLSCSE